MKVVSLLPSATEIVACVGGLEFLVGRSHECNFPEEVLKLPVLTAAKTPFVSSKQMNDAVTETLASGSGLYTIDGNLLRELRPDVVVTQSLCAVCSVDFNLVRQVAQTMEHQPVLVDLNPQCLDEVLEGCLLVGAALSLEEEAQRAMGELKHRIRQVTDTVHDIKMDCIPTVAFLEWVDPIFVGGHWTPQLIQMAGGSHPLNPPKAGGGGAASYAISNEDFAKSDPDWVIVCPCGLNIEETEREMKPIQKSDWWMNLRAVREGRVVLVDGDQMFNRPGPRLVDALEWLVGLFGHRPDIMPASFPWKSITPSKDT